MESNDVSKFIGKEVMWATKGNMLADITGYEKGWVTIKTDDGEEHKVRAKDIVLMDSVEELAETEEGLVTVEDPSLDSSGTGSLEEGEFDPEAIVTCNCGRSFVPPRSESYKCPDCDRWFKVRLHPNLEHYVKGMAATASGRDTVDIDDSVATMLRGLDLDALYDVVCEEMGKLSEGAVFSKPMTAAFKKSGMTCFEFLVSKFGKLNPGMQRMNLGNMLRGAYKRDQIIKNTPKPVVAPPEAVVTAEAVVEQVIEITTEGE